MRYQFMKCKCCGKEDKPVRFGIEYDKYLEDENKCYIYCPNCEDKFVEECTDKNKDILDNIPDYNNVDIRNYANQLLYNDKNLDITYEISFQLIGTSDGGVYNVTDGKETKSISDSESVTFTNRILKGGKQSYDRFQVSVTRPENENSDSKYRSVGIRVTATPVSPSFVTTSSKLGGILYASMLSATYSLVSNFNQVTDTLENYTGFPYTISYTPGEDQAAHEIKIRWKNNLEIDQFNPYYLKAKENGMNADDTVDNVTWHSMKITMQPYSTIQIVFYRSSGFNDSSVKLSECVQVEDLTKTSGGSGN